MNNFYMKKFIIWQSFILFLISLFPFTPKPNTLFPLYFSIILIHYFCLPYFHQHYFSLISFLLFYQIHPKLPINITHSGAGIPCRKQLNMLSFYTNISSNNNHLDLPLVNADRSKNVENWETL